MDKDTNVPNNDVNEQDTGSQPVMPNQEVADTSPEQKPVDSAEYPVIEENVAPQVTAALPKKSKKKHTLFIVVVTVLVLLGVAFFVWKDKIIGIFVKQSVASQTTQNSGTTTPTQTKITDPALLKFITPTTGESWYATPKEMANQGLLNNDYRETFVASYLTAAQTDENYNRMKPTYYEVGTHSDKTIIMARMAGEVGPDYAVLFEKQSNGSFSIIAKQSSTASYDGGYNTAASLKDMLRASKAVTIDQTTHYDSLSLPDVITLPSGETVVSMKSPVLTFGTQAQGSAETVAMDLGSSKLYRIEKSYADTKLTNIGYVIRTNFGTEMQVDYIPNTRSLEKYVFDNGKVATYKNYDGAMVYDTIGAIARGCGGTTAAVTRADNLQDSDLVQVGKTDGGRAIYTLKDTASALMSKAYDEYKQSYDKPVTLSEYITNHGLLIVKNASGERLVYVRGQYGMSGGCAKPVVYLYPTVAENVSVKVGADVTVSEPQYGASGWQNVFARPNGQLTYNGKAYDSLFWEGKGYGDYPGITSGTVVKRVDAVATIKRQLSEQGLNAKETADFMAFWEGKIPNKPYIRLTWLNTAQMNALAPLYVSPKPDTLIRVFLDMDGFDAPVSLPVQKLTSTARQGFTVVEWGGLTSEIRH